MDALISSSPGSLTSRSTESMERELALDSDKLLGEFVRSDTPLNDAVADNHNDVDAQDNDDTANLMSTDTEKSIVVAPVIAPMVAPSMALADSSPVVNEYDETEQEIITPHSHHKRKRASTVNYDESDYGKALKASPSADGPAKRGKVAKPIRGVIIGLWRDSDQLDDDNKHVIFGFIDIHDRLRTRIYAMNRRGEDVFGNAPTGAGGCWVTFERIVFDQHLVGLSALEIKEYVKIRSASKPEVDLEERYRSDAKAVLRAKAIVAEQEAANPTKPVAPRTSLARQSLSRQSLPRQSLQKNAGFQAVNSANTQAPQAASGAENKPHGVLLGYWSDSNEPRLEDKHAVYGVLSETDCFRVKVQRLTRDGRYVDGNFPVGAGALWIGYKKVVFEPHLAPLSRPEVKEYCRIRQHEQDGRESEKERKANEMKAVLQARINVERGLNHGAEARFPSPEMEVRHSARSEHRVSARHQAEAEAVAEEARKEKAEARERQYAKTRQEVAMAEAIIKETAQMELKNNMKKLNKVWVAQQAATTASTAATPEAVDDDVKYHHGIKYERKHNGPFQGKLVSQAQILSIDGEDYVEYRILTKPFF
ncbi:hypothetical protein LZ554_000670 [Drepanopeziza brunnea f. sp. 'monogermtubi']|nr:hypothetical protein LZ554_000670 [Drepanopeziza brunnea f. sp. 'monogermtubi']